jgi:hypothetical protein
MALAAEDVAVELEAPALERRQLEPAHGSRLQLGF